MFGAAGSEQPAVAARWWVAVPYQPAVAETPREQFRHAVLRARGKTSWAAHHAAAVGSLQLTGQIQAALAGAGIETYLLDGVPTLALLWERVHPAAEPPDLDLLADAVSVAQATSTEAAAQQRHRVLRALCDGAPAGIDAGENPGFLRHADGTLEEILHLGTPPLQTSPWWLAHLLSCPLPTTVAVHITVGHRGREQGRQRRRWKRLRAAVMYKQRHGQLVGSDEEEALGRGAGRRRRARLRDRRDRLPGRDLLRDPRPPRRRRANSKRLVGDTAREFHALTNARVVRGRRLCLPGLTATLPLGVDPLNARRSYAQRNIAHCVPLTSTSCGSPSGLILGFSDPGGTVERIDPFDPLYPRRVTLVLGPSGGGKTVLMNVLLDARDLAGDARLDHRPLIHPGPRRSDRRHGALRHAAVAGARLAAGAGRLERR